MKYKIVVDSSSNLSKDYIKDSEIGFEVVPLTILVDGNDFVDNRVVKTVAEGKDVHLVEGGKKYAFVTRNNTGLDQAFRFSPIVTYKVQNMTIGLEYEHTAAAYGTYQSNGTVTNTHWVANHRACMMLKYDF